MKKFTKMTLAFLACFLLAGMLCSCGGGEQGGGGKERITLTVWGAENDQAMLKEMCAAFAEANPDKEYKFLYGVQGEGDAADKVLNDVTAGPDVF